MSQLQEHKYIVFCGNNYNALGICRSLGEKGIDPIVVTYTDDNYLLKHCRYVKHLHKVSTHDEGLQLIINKWGNEPEKPFIYTMDDYTAMFLDEHYNELKDHFYFFHSQGNLAYYLEKKNICDLAEECGIPQPKGEVLKKGELPKHLCYPVLTKTTSSNKGAWKNDVFICQNEEELKEAYTHIVADELLVQEYIVKKNELCVDGLSLNGGEDIVLSYTSEYLRMPKNSYGCYMKMIPYENKEVCDKIKAIIRGANYTGIFCLEALIDTHDNLWFLEVNFRNSGWSYAHTFGGMNLPYYWAKWTLEEKTNISECTIRCEPFTAMDELADLSQVYRMSDVSFRTWFKQFRACDCPYIYNKNDIWPFYHAIWYKIKTVFKHKVLRRR